MTQLWGPEAGRATQLDRIVVLGRIRGRARETGREFEVLFADIWTASDGVPSRLRSYFDTAPTTAALEP